MLTEQEAVAKLNEKIAKSDVKSMTKRFLAKIETLQSRLAAQNAEIEELEDALVLVRRPEGEVPLAYQIACATIARRSREHRAGARRQVAGQRRKGVTQRRDRRSDFV